MKLLCLCKRRPQGRDLLNRPYGRFFNFPLHLAQQGHQVTLLLLSYRSDPAENRMEHGLEWHSESLAPLWTNQGPRRYVTLANQLASDLQPDWIIGFSDTWYGILAQRLAEKHGCKSLIDAYDNYESYIPWCTLLHLFWRKAIKRATAITAAGPGLADLLARHRTGISPTVVPMAADDDFRPLDKLICRKRFNLPPDKKLIGYCGALFRSRGIDLLFTAYEEIRQLYPDSLLVLSGRRGKGVRIPANARWLGYLPDSAMPEILNCFDLLTVINQLSAFGRHSHPVKLYEAMACEIPVVATRTPATEYILANNERFLAAPGDCQDLIQKIERNLGLGRNCYGTLSTWDKACDIFEQVLLG